MTVSPILMVDWQVINLQSSCYQPSSYSVVALKVALSCTPEVHLQTAKKMAPVEEGSLSLAW